MNVFNTLILIQIFWKTKNWSIVFWLKPLRLKAHHFYSKLLCQKAMLKQIEWWLKNWPITKSGVLPVTALFLWKICFSFRTSWKESIWCTNDPNVHIYIFHKHWSLILGCFFPVSIHKWNTEFIFCSKLWYLWNAVGTRVIKNFNPIKNNLINKINLFLWKPGLTILCSMSEGI